MVYYVTFSVLPVFSSTPSSSVSVPSIRESLRVRCSAKGSPLPTVTWYKNDISVPVINNVTNDEFTSELVISEFQLADQATYKCVARNVYNNTVETSTRICKSRTVLMKISSPWSSIFCSRQISGRRCKNSEECQSCLPSRCYLRFFLSSTHRNQKRNNKKILLVVQNFIQIPFTDNSKTQRSSRQFGNKPTLLGYSLSI